MEHRSFLPPKEITKEDLPRTHHEGARRSHFRTQAHASAACRRQPCVPTPKTSSFPCPASFFYLSRSRRDRSSIMQGHVMIMTKLKGNSCISVDPLGHIHWYRWSARNAAGTQALAWTVAEMWVNGVPDQEKMQWSTHGEKERPSRGHDGRGSFSLCINRGRYILICLIN